VTHLRQSVIPRIALTEYLQRLIEAETEVAQHAGITVAVPGAHRTLAKPFSGAAHRLVIGVVNDSRNPVALLALAILAENIDKPPRSFRDRHVRLEDVAPGFHFAARCQHVAVGALDVDAGAELVGAIRHAGVILGKAVEQVAAAGRRARGECGWQLMLGGELRQRHVAIAAHVDV